MSTQNLKFIHLSTGSASAHKADTGAIIFEKESGRIAVANGSDKVEYYGGGRVSDAKFENSILTISFNDTAETIKLDFSDVASTSGVNKILGQLRTDVNALRDTVNGKDTESGHQAGLVDKVKTNTTNIASNKAAIDLINHETNGILAQAKTYTDTKVKALKDSHDALLNGLRTDVDSNSGKITALQELHASDGADGRMTVKQEIDAKVGTGIAGTVKDYVDTEIGKVNTEAGNLDDRVTALETTVNNAETGLVKKVADNAKNIADNAKAIADNAKNIASINNESTGILAQAKTYTDGKIGDIDGKTVKEYVTGEVSAINRVTGGLRTDVDTLKATVGNEGSGLVKDVADNTGKLNTLIGEDVDKSVRTISAEEVAKVVANAPESYDTLKEIADWIANDTTGSTQMANDIATLKTTVGKPANGDEPATGLHKDIADNKSAINVNAGAIKALQGLHVSGKTVAQEVTDGIKGLDVTSKSNTTGSDVVVTVTTTEGKVSAVAVDAGVLAGKVTAEKSRAEGIEKGLRTDVNAVRSDLGTKTADEGDAFTRIKALEKKQADGTLMWSVWDN